MKNHKTIKKENTLSFETLTDAVSYDKATGLFIWNYKKGSLGAGRIAGTKCDRYIQIKINKTPYKAHRLAWFYANGTWPKDQIDHINGDKADNRIVNLREASHVQNMKNRRSIQKTNSGLRNVHKVGSKFRAYITANGKRHDLGRHDTAEAAHAVYVRSAKKLHGKFACM